MEGNLPIIRGLEVQPRPLPSTHILRQTKAHLLLLQQAGEGFDHSSHSRLGWPSRPIHCPFARTNISVKFYTRPLEKWKFNDGSVATSTCALLDSLPVVSSRHAAARFRALGQWLVCAPSHHPSCRYRSRGCHFFDIQRNSCRVRFSPTDTAAEASPAFHLSRFPTTHQELATSTLRSRAERSLPFAATSDRAVAG